MTAIKVGFVVGACVLAVGIVVAVAMAQPAGAPASDNQKKTEAPVKTGAPASETKPAAAPGFPAIKEKRLFANKDLRGKQAPKFEVEKWLTKEPSREGKVVLIDFWATWCGPCRALAPELEQWQAKFKDELVIIGVSDEKGAEAKILQFAKDKSLTYPMAIDTNAKMKNVLDVQGIPNVIIVDTKGVVRWQGWPQNPEEPLTEGVIKSIIDADKAQRGKPATETKPSGTGTPAVDPKR